MGKKRGAEAPLYKSVTATTLPDVTCHSLPRDAMTASTGLAWTLHNQTSLDLPHLDCLAMPKRVLTIQDQTSQDGLAIPRRDETSVAIPEHERTRLPCRIMHRSDRPRPIKHWGDLPPPCLPCPDGTCLDLTLPDKPTLTALPNLGSTELNET